MYTTLLRTDRVLSLMDLRDPNYYSRHRDPNSVTFAGGLSVSAKEIIRFFGWKEETYSQKATAYIWARRAARPETQWDGPIPGPLDSFLFIGLYVLVLTSHIRSHAG